MKKLNGDEQKKVSEEEKKFLAKYAAFFWEKGWDFFTTDPGAEESITCPTCNEVMEVERNACGATSSIMAMAGKKRYYDRFFCKFAEEKWHRQAKMLKKKAENTRSKKLKLNFLKEAEKTVKTKSVPNSNKIENELS